MRPPWSMARFAKEQEELERKEKERKGRGGAASATPSDYELEEATSQQQALETKVEALEASLAVIAKLSEGRGAQVEGLQAARRADEAALQQAKRSLEQATQATATAAAAATAARAAAAEAEGAGKGARKGAISVESKKAFSEACAKIDALAVVGAARREAWRVLGGAPLLHARRRARGSFSPRRLHDKSNGRPPSNDHDDDEREDGHEQGGR